MVDLFYDPYATFFLVFWIQYSFYFVFCIYLFFSKNVRNSVYIKSRSPALIVSSACGQYLMMTMLTWKIVVTPQLYPNMVDLWFLFFAIPLHFIPYPIRSLRFIIQYHLLLPSSRLGDDDDYDEDNPKPKMNIWIKINDHKKWVSDKMFTIYNWILMAIAFLIGLVRNIIIPENHPGNNGQANSSTYYITCMILLIIVSVFLWLAVFFLKKIHDQLAYTSELMSIGIIWIVFISLYVITGWAKLGPLQLPPIIAIVLCVLSFMISFGMPIQLALAKPVSANLGHERLDNLNVLLEDKKGSYLFLDFLNQSMCPEGYHFLRAVQKYRTLSTEEQRIMFPKIVSRYISSEDAINIHADIIRQLKEMDPNQADLFTFDKAYDENFKVLRTDMFLKFQSTDEAKNYAKELTRQHANAVSLNE